jgi:hypothetical protein
VGEDARASKKEDASLTDNAKQQALDLDTMEPSAQLPAPVAPRQEPKAGLVPAMGEDARASKKEDASLIVDR